MADQPAAASNPASTSACSANAARSAASASNAAWTGEGEILEDFIVGEYVYMLNPYFSDGTRLRIGPNKEDDFTGEHILNDARCVILDLSDNGFAQTPMLNGAGAHRGSISDLMPTETDEELMQSKASDSAQQVSSIMSFSRSYTRAAKGLARMDAAHLAAQLEKRREEAQEQVRTVRAQLRQRKRTTLDPHSTFMQRWDSVTMMAMLFTATVTPLEVCVMDPIPLDAMVTDPLAWLNRLVDMVFVIDICMQCFLAYQEPPDKGGGWVHDNWMIVKQYATTWMPLDVLTAVPVDVIVAAYEAGQSADDAAGGANYLRIVRMLRLLKLARVLRASRIFRRWQAHFGISFAMLALMKFIALAFITSHWMACSLALIGNIPEAPTGDPSTLSENRGFFGTSWIHDAGLTDATPAEIYSVALFVAYGMITSGSSGKIVPTTMAEHFLFTAATILGSGLFAYVLSSACGIIASLNPSLLHYRQTMDELNFFARDKKLPRAMTIQLREFLTQTSNFQRQKRYDELLDCFSSQLKAQAALHWAKESLMRVPYFQSGTVEDDFLASAALALRSRVLCRTESISVNCLLVIERGIAARDGRIATKGACLGTDVVLNTETFRDLSPAVALTAVVQVACLMKQDLEALVVSYPRARREIRAASFRIAFTRAVIQIAKEISYNTMMGYSQTIEQAFVAIRKRKQRNALEQATRVGEPTRKLLASSLSGLATRTETIARESETQRQMLSDQLKSLSGHVADLDAKFGAVLAALNRGPDGARLKRGSTAGVASSLRRKSKPNQRNGVPATVPAVEGGAGARALRPETPATASDSATNGDDDRAEIRWEAAVNGGSGGLDA